jgi:hypothetical protein
MDATKEANANKGIISILALFAVIFFALALYVIFSPNVPELRYQAVTWVALSLVCAICIPFASSIIDIIKRIRKIVFPGGSIDIDKESTTSTTKDGKKDTSGIKQVVDYLFDEKAELDQQSIVNSLQRADPLALECIYNFAEGWRMLHVYELINNSPDLESQNESRKKIDKLQIIYKGLLKVTPLSVSLRHSCFAGLAFVLKDGSKPNYPEAFDNINQAIKVIELTSSDNAKKMALPLYKFNRFICSLNLDHCSNEEREKYYREVLGDPTAKLMLDQTDNLIAPRLKAWIEDDKRKKRQAKVTAVREQKSSKTN